jgi:Ca2+/Na+ antiporter
MIAFLLALFLALAKRRDDVLIFEKTGVAMRRNTERLNRTFLDAALVIVATVLMVSYIMYTVSDSVIRRLGTEYLYVTSLFVLLGILRYLQRTLVDNESGSPTRILLHDRFVQFAIAGWLLVFGIIIYS